jgi:hypothetical protein
VEDAVNHPLFQKLAAIVMIGGGLTQVFNWVVAIIGVLVSISIIRKNIAAERKYNAQAKILESKEKARKSEVEERHLKGEPCRRCTDDEVENHEGH